MRHLATILFVLVGLVNFVPIVGVLGAERLEAVYGVPITHHDLLLLLRHRSVLFGLLGGLLIFAAFRPQWRPLATVAGLVSMITYLLLAWPIPAHGVAVQKVFWADAVATVLLIAAYLISRNNSGARLSISG
jgi:hypothetical protein